MPALVESETMASEDLKKLKKSGNGSSADSHKKSKKTKIDYGSDSEEIKKSKKKDKKRKALSLDDQENGNSEVLESINLNEDEKKKKKKKKKKKEEDEAKLVEEDSEEKEEDPNALSNFRISVPLKEVLNAKGINALFPIQAMTFDTILDGSDLVGRARTGQVCTICNYLLNSYTLKQHFLIFFLVFS